MSFHSIDELECRLDSIGRWDARASQIIIINIIRAVKEIMDPIDEITFHFIKASG